MKNTIKVFIAFLLLTTAFPSLVKADDSAILDQMFPNLVLKREYYAQFKEDIEKRGSNPAKLYFVNNYKSGSDLIVRNDVKPRPAKSIDNNPDNTIDSDMYSIYRLCVAYAMTLNEDYLDKAVEFLVAWSEFNVSLRKRNIHEGEYVKAVEGYSIIRNLIDEDSRNIIDGWIRRRIDLYIDDNDFRRNNWGTALLNQIYTAGLALNDANYINWFESRYDNWVKGNLFPNGTGHDLLARDAFAYHAYNLMFFGKLCHAIAMYKGYEAADEFYARDINWGASIKKSVDFWKPFLLDPVKNPHREFVETEWSGDHNRSDYKQIYNPSGTVYAVDELFEFDYSLLEVIDKYRGGNVFATQRLGLGAMRWYYLENQ